MMTTKSDGFAKRNAGFVFGLRPVEGFDVGQFFGGFNQALVFFDGKKNPDSSAFGIGKKLRRHGS